jgi:hypothetical protein
MWCSRPTFFGCYAYTLNLWFFGKNFVYLFKQLVVVRLCDDLVACFLIQDEDIVV